MSSNQQDDVYFLGEALGSSVLYLETKGDIYEVTDNGQTWTNITPEEKEPQDDVRYFRTSQDNTRQVVMVSKNPYIRVDGNDWISITPPLAFNLDRFLSDANCRTLLATKYNVVYSSVDGGMSWTSQMLDWTLCYFDELRLSDDGTTAYVSNKSNAWQSADGGATWTQIDDTTAPEAPDATAE